MTAATSATTATQAQVHPGRTRQRVTTVISYAILFALAAMFLYPFLYAVLTSFKPLPEIAANTAQLWPETWTLNAGPSTAP
jgi:multiple sugar transport system permease protein